MLEVVLHTTETLAAGLDAALVFEEIDFVSLVNNETYGPPALVAPTPARPNQPGRSPDAKVGDRVLYLNTNSALIAFEIERVSD
jgi:hypothetical protein